MFFDSKNLLFSFRFVFIFRTSRIFGTKTFFIAILENICIIFFASYDSKNSSRFYLHQNVVYFIVVLCFLSLKLNSIYNCLKINYLKDYFIDEPLDPAKTAFWLMWYAFDA